MTLLKDIKTWTGLDPESITRAADVSRDSPLFAYVMIPGDIHPKERARFETPLQQALDAAELGDITGGGSQLDDPAPDGTPRVAFCGLDLELYAVEPALALARDQLQKAGAPRGTVILYELEGHEYENDIWAPQTGRG